MGWTNSYTGELTANAFLSSDMMCEHEGRLHIRMADMEKTIILTPRRRRLGGHQWYFMGPHEDRCCSVLWRPPGAREFAADRAGADVLPIARSFSIALTALIAAKRRSRTA